MKLTASRALKEKLELARDLMSHGNPSGNLAVVVERALDVFLAQLEQKKLGRTERPDCQRVRRVAAHEPAKKETAVGAKVRSHVTRRARRAVVAEDGLRCSFVAPGGHRCEARAFLEFDHIEPKGLGGGSEPRNIRISCRAHNRLAAERIFGKAHVARKIQTSRADGETIRRAHESPTAVTSSAEPGETPAVGRDPEVTSSAAPGETPALGRDPEATSSAEPGETPTLHDEAVAISGERQGGNLLVRENAHVMGHPPQCGQSRACTARHPSPTAPRPHLSAVIPARDG